MSWSIFSSIVPRQTNTFDLNDRLTTDNYDANGNTLLGHDSIGVPFGTDQYDFEDHLVQRTTVVDGQPATITMIYDGDGNRVVKSVAGTNTGARHVVRPVQVRRR